MVTEDGRTGTYRYVQVRTSTYRYAQVRRLVQARTIASRKKVVMDIDISNVKRESPESLCNADMHVWS